MQSAAILVFMANQLYGFQKSFGKSFAMCVTSEVSFGSRLCGNKPEW